MSTLGHIEQAAYADLAHEVMAELHGSDETVVLSADTPVAFAIEGQRARDVLMQIGVEMLDAEEAKMRRLGWKVHFIANLLTPLTMADLDRLGWWEN